MTLSADYTVSVRTLCDFTARSGDLDLRFTPGPTAQQGIAGHQMVAARRPAGYEREITLQGQYGRLTVRGRADGFDPQRRRLEEIKTHRGDLQRQPAHHRVLHWAQLKVYGWLLCEARGLESLQLALVYLDIASHEETVIEQTWQASDLRAFFEARCEAFCAWAAQELRHRQARDEALAQLPFPYQDFRTGQRELAASVWRAARTGGALMAQAPTGIGKTLATLFPMLRAAPQRGLDKVIFLAARTPGRQLALDALQRLQPHAQAQGACRTLELVARDKACEHPDKACHGDACPLARGFYDRLAAARLEALGTQDAASLRLAALRHQVCPYWLSQEMVRWSDVIVGDYNYWFDASAGLHAQAVEQDWRCAVLVDEAHNLPERARQMYSASLDDAPVRALRRDAPAALKKPMDKLVRQWRELARLLPEGAASHYQVLDALPPGFLTALQQAASAVADELAQTPQAPQAQWQTFYFEALAFTRLAESFGEHSILDLTRRPGARRPVLSLCLRNLLPAPHLAPRIAQAQPLVLFSATLEPPGYYQDMLGLPQDTPWIDVPTPFQPGQLSVRLVPGISTRWSQRARSVQPIADLIARQWRERPGNYLAYFSSYDYLGQVAQALQDAAPEVPQWRQSPGMTEAQRRAFTDRFTPEGQGVGFAVLGGSFGEGIDLPGERLVGAFIATLGMPQVNEVNEQLRQRLEQVLGAGTGFDYAYVYPGLRKVVQAAGRVIRTTEDRGVVYLIDDRFSRAQIRRLLPSWWQPQVVK